MQPEIARHFHWCCGTRSLKKVLKTMSITKYFDCKTVLPHILSSTAIKPQIHFIYKINEISGNVFSPVL